MRSVLFVLVAGCGRIGFDATAVQSDDASTPSDGTAGAFHCATWSTPVRVDDLSTTVTYEYEPALHPDLPLVVLSSNRGGNGIFRLYAASGEDLTWAMPAAIDTDSLPGDTEVGPEWAADGRTLYFSSAKSSQMRIYTMPFDFTNFGPPELLGDIAENAAAVAVRFDELEMFYMRSALPEHMRRASRASTSDPWIADADYIFSGTGMYQGWGSLAADGLEIYFEVGTGIDEDIYRSTRDSLTGLWTAPLPVTELHSDFDDGDPELSHDGHTLMFSSDRINSGDPDLFVSTCDVPR